MRYVPVQWNGFKYLYDLAFVAATVVYLFLFLRYGPHLAGPQPGVDGAIHIARAFGSCAFLMLSVILAIGPLARLDRRFLPLLYNRRHFGVVTFFVAATHATAVVNWYFNFSPVPKLNATLSANTSYGQLLGFPFEAFGVFALIALAVLAFTSHDFWLKFLTPRIWKAAHYLIYPAYLAVVLHVSLGALQDETNAVFAVVVAAAAGAVCVLHAWAALVERRRAVTADLLDGWRVVGRDDEIAEGRAKVVLLGNGDRVAVFRHEGAFSAISNACAHQNGPLGEGRILDGCVTCPWHGFQYDVRNGRTPAPFTDRVPTYNLRRQGDLLLVDPRPNPPGTPTEPVPALEAAT